MAIRANTAKGQPQSGKSLAFTQLSRLKSARTKEFNLQSLFKYGYRNKEDISNLPPQTLVVGSQNVLTNAAELVGIRQGYELDGTAGNQNSYGIDSAYDFLSRQGNYENLRKWGTTLEVRYVNPETSAITWETLLSTLSTNVVNFTNFWDAVTESKMFCLFVNGDNNLYEWSGGVGSYASSDNTAGHIAVLNATPTAAGTGYVVGDVVTITTGGTGATATVLTIGGGGAVTAVALTTVGSGYSTGTGKVTTGGSGNGALTLNITTVSTGAITLSGTKTTDELGFYSQSGNSGKFKVLLNETEYTYTSVFNQTFLGISPSPLLVTHTVGDAVLQSVSSITGASVATNGSGNLGTSFEFDLIGTLENQVWYGSFLVPNIYVSNTNDYDNLTFTVPARLPSEGALIVLDSFPTGFFQQSNEMYITAGTDQWWISQKLAQTIDVASIATPVETLFASRLKTARNQGAISQALIGQYKNSLVYVSNEPIINTLGLIKDIQQDPQVTNISDPIKYDIDAYDFTGGQVIYDNYFIYITIPVNNVVRMYNVVKQYWEAPQVLPVSRFYRITGGSTIYGHSSLTNESYKMFTGYNDNGNPINAVAAFPYTCVLGGSPTQKKAFNKLYTEGYISSNTTLMATVNYDFGGFTGTYTALISGNQGKPATKNTIFNKVTDGSIGQNTLGSQPIGTILNLAQNNPKFRIINTMPRLNMFEYQTVYSSNDIDQQWTLLRFGPAISSAEDIGPEITI